MNQEVSNHQDDVINQAIEILQTHRRLVFKGSAGTGKTYCMEELVNRLQGTRHTSKRIVCSAPTHQALAVLKGKINLNVDFQTAHSLLKYKKVTNTENGIETFRPFIDPRYPPMKDISLLIIDESSMIPSEMLWYLEEYGRNITIIFVGDDKQAFPVGERVKPVFMGKPTRYTVEELDPTRLYHKAEEFYYTYEQYPSVELTEIVRQGAGNPVITLSRHLNAIWDFQQRLNEEGTEGFLYTVNEPKIIDELSIANGNDTFKYIAYTNDEVNRMNTLVRQAIYGPFPAKIEAGETIVFSSPYGKYVNNEKLLVETLDVDDIVFNVVTQDKRGIVTKEMKFKCYIINGKQVEDPWGAWSGAKSRWTGIFVIHEQSESALKSLYYTLTTNCRNKLLDYTTRNEFFNNFAEFKYNHALTVHKAQGSTFDTVVMNITNVNTVYHEDERESLFYTGVTRTKNLLILYHTKR